MDYLKRNWKNILIVFLLIALFSQPMEEQTTVKTVDNSKNLKACQQVVELDNETLLRTSDFFGVMSEIGYLDGDAFTTKIVNAIDELTNYMNRTTPERVRLIDICYGKSI
jgi:hypothetical protein